MKIVYASQTLPKSIFLAGPTPRDEQTPSWRPEALKLLEALKFDGTVIVPENADGGCGRFDYDQNAKWEWDGLNSARVVVFWVPRELHNMPAFTTNVEFGLMAATGKVLLGYPKDAPKMRYLHTLAERYNIPVFNDLPALLGAAVARCT